MNAVVLASGDELVLGQNVDTNSAWISARLAAHGVMTRWHLTVGDDLGELVRALRRAVAEADLVILTGGLGPTQDDLTREALAQVLGTPLEPHAPSLERIRGFFQRIERPMPETNAVQALCPRGAHMLDNDWGTAPGLEATVGRARILAFPGVPRELFGMFDRYVLPHVAEHGGRAIRLEALRTFGAGESAVAERLGDLMRRDRNPLVGTTASAGLITVRIRSDFPTAAQADRALAETVREAETRLGTLVFGRGEGTLPAAVLDLLKARGATLTTAESCTGGLVAKLVTDVPGASAVYLGGWVVYANALKTGQLAVPAELLAQHGAVSEPVARALATQALAAAGAAYALALTGIAGPDGGTAEKPVGTVWIALAARGAGGPTVVAERYRFPGERDVVRDRAAKTALNTLRLALLGGRPA